MIVKGGWVAFSGESSFKKCDIEISNGKIRAIGESIATCDNHSIEAEGLYVFPGGIDPHVHFYTPGYPHKESFFTGTSAAARGGITTVIDMPCTSIPPVTNIENLKTKLKVVEKEAVIDFGFYGGLSKETFDADYNSYMEEMANSVMGYKVYAVSGMPTYGSVDYHRLSQIIEKAKQLNRPVLLHAEEPGYVYRADRYWRGQGKSPRHYYNSRPELAELLAVDSAASVAEELKGDLHIVHIGTAKAGERLQGSPVTGETCPHYLAFGLKEFEEQGPLLKVAPSIKEGYNREKLWELLKSGTISFIASDHAPGSREEKSGDDIWENSSGIAGVETMLPYLFSEGFMKKRLSLKRYLEVISEKGAKRYNLFDRKGSIQVGKEGDLVLIDPKRDFTVGGDKLFSQAKQTPFEGWRFQGEIQKTVVRGAVVYDAQRGVTVDKGYGRFCRPT